MCVTVEERALGYPDDVPAGWLPAEGVSALEIQPQGDGDEVVWTVRIPLPEPKLFRPRRLLVREIERYLADDPKKGYDAANPINVPRVVYVDVLNLDK
jgi:hypothetical protein